MHRIIDALLESRAARHFREELPDRGEQIDIGGAVGSAGHALFAALHEEHPERIFVAVAADPNQATAVEADLEVLLGEGTSVLYPQRESLPYEAGEPHLEIGGLRVEAIEALLGGRSRVLVTTPRALQERTPLPRRLADLRLTLEVGAEMAFSRIVEELESRGFERTPIVEEVGQFAVRGGLLDVFSFGTPEPMRVEFWGDEIESIRFFDILDQRSTRSVNEAHVLPVDFGSSEDEDHRKQSLLELLPADALLVSLGEMDWAGRWTKLWDYATELHDHLRETGSDPEPPSEVFIEPADAVARTSAHPRLVIHEGEGADVTLDAVAPPPIERDMKRLKALLREGGAKGTETLILCDNAGQVERLDEILGSRIPGTQLAVGSLAGGFVLPSLDPPLQILTDHEIFRRSRRIRRSRRFRGAVALESLSQLTPGDFVVHLDHGIGVFRGLEHIDVAGRELESMKVEYAGGEVLLVLPAEGEIRRLIEVAP